jgi:hypothetical protein
VIDPVTRFVRGRGSDQEVKVITGPACTWTARSNVSWVEVRGDGEGTGTRDVRYEVDRNRSGSTRIGTITLAGLTHFIVQEPGDNDD